MTELSQDALNELKAVFEHVDLNHNGTLEICEFRELLIALSGRLKPGEAEARFHAIDVNSDGVISWDEFVTWWSIRTS